jgi:CheY-like chemotaxis protein
VLFTDIRLPGQLDGWAIARRARQVRAALPVIYATGYTVDRSAEVPGAIFLNKPYQPSQVVEIIDRLLALSRTA